MICLNNFFRPEVPYSPPFDTPMVNFRDLDCLLAMTIYIICIVCLVVVI